MGSGEDLGYLKVQALTTGTTVSNNTTGDYWPGTSTPLVWGDTVTWNYTTKIYMYQIKCPECKAKTFMELETITPCEECGAKLWAAKEIPDHTIQVK